MIFFVGNDGTVIKSVPSAVYQGGANANTVYLIAPFAENLSASVAFQLPNGVAVAPAPMTPQDTIDGVTDAQGNVYSGWAYAMPNDITALYGTVIAQFFFYSAQGGVVASSAVNFIVGRGVPAVLPDAPDDDVYSQLLSIIGSLQSDLHNGYYASRAVYAWNDTYAYGANEITFYPDIGKYGAFVKSVVDDNTNNVPYVNGAINSAYWEEVANFNTIADDFYADIKAAQIAAEAAQTAAEAAQEAAETAETNAEAATHGAQTAQGKAEAAQAAAEAAQAASETAEANAKAAEGEAAASAGQAASSAASASEKASSALQSATAAKGYMEQAREYAQKEYKLYDSVDDLPIPGNSAFIYLVPQDSAEETDNYAEYLWISENEKYEFIGTVNDINLSNYAQKNGTYPGMTVGNAASADSATSASDVTDTINGHAVSSIFESDGETVKQATNAEMAESIIGTEISDGGDLNNCFVEGKEGGVFGWYCAGIASSNNIANTPYPGNFNTPFYLLTLQTSMQPTSANTRFVQVLYGISGDYKGQMFQRARDSASNEWTEWVRVFTTGDVIDQEHGGTGTSAPGDIVKSINGVYSRNADNDQMPFSANWLTTHSMIGSVYDNGEWYYIINVRHRGGSGDGASYGLQIVTKFTNNAMPEPLQYRVQRYVDGQSSWSDWDTLYSENNPQTTDGNGNNISTTYATKGGKFIPTMWNNGYCTPATNYPATVEINVNDIALFVGGGGTEWGSTYNQGDLFVITSLQGTGDRRFDIGAKIGNILGTS